MNDNVVKIYQLIGICQKARKLVSGEFPCKQAVLSNRACLVIVAEDASENTKKLFKDKCIYRKIQCIFWGKKEKLGNILGKEQRAVIAILDKNLALKLSEMIEVIH